MFPEVHALPRGCALAAIALPSTGFIDPIQGVALGLRKNSDFVLKGRGFKPRRSGLGENAGFSP